MKNITLISFVLLLLLPTGFALGDDKSPLDIYYQDQITHVESKSGNFYLEPELRFQVRYSNPFENNPTSVTEIAGSDYSSFEINRARLKAEGHVWRPWFDIKFEYDLKNSRLLDARITLAKYEWLQFRFGQMKAHYNPERVASSKDLTMVERTMVNDYFTVDRQQGISVMGRLNKGGLFDSNYWVDVLTGEGRDTDSSIGNNNKHMWIAHYQWNFLGNKLSRAMGDLALSKKPAAHVGIATLRNTSRFSGFDSKGGIQLPGFTGYGDNEQYTIKQWMFHARFHYSGLSLQGEYHEKEVQDNIVDTTTKMRGYYMQSGFFPAPYWPTISPAFELTARIAQVYPDTSDTRKKLSEILLGANWYIFGHRNKVTTDIGRYDVAEVTQSYDELRFRLQYDLSF